MTKRILLLVLLGTTLCAAQEHSSLEIFDSDGTPERLSKSASGRILKKFSEDLKSKEHGLQLAFGKKAAGTIRVALLINDEGDVTNLSVVHSSISDSSTERTLLYTFRQWSFDLDLDHGSARAICSFAFDSSTANAPPWRYTTGLSCGNHSNETKPVSGLLGLGGQVCIYIVVPRQPDQPRTFSTFRNTEWKLLREAFENEECESQAAWRFADSATYVMLDSLLGPESSQEQLAITTLPDAIASQLSAAGFTRLVAFYRHRGAYTDDESNTIRVGGATTYHGAGGTSSSGGPVMALTIPSRSTIQSILVSVYDVHTGKGLLHKAGKETDYSFEEAINALVGNLFGYLKTVE